jgi:hypothetical protein
LTTEADRKAGTRAALEKWADLGAKKPKRDYRPTKKKAVDPRKKLTLK